ncbi:MAG: hypothetical protein HFF06_04625 [Oscillospiraceae bacterium]|nr:hypothetical protein [Oscillospiraceae bacterium]
MNIQPLGTGGYHHFEDNKGMTMKKIRSQRMIPVLCAGIVLITALTSCGNGDSLQNSTFPQIDNAKIPDALEITVGTLGNCSFSDGITDDPDYNSILTVTFNDTDEADYSTLMEHYKSTSTGTGENGSLLFDWGTLQVTTDNGSILINAFIK